MFASSCLIVWLNVDCPTPSRAAGGEAAFFGHGLKPSELIEISACHVGPFCST